MRLRVFSALRALVNIELPLAASPPMPSPLGLCSSTEMISNMPVTAQSQLRMDCSMIDGDQANVGRE